MIDQRRLARFLKMSPLIATQKHLDKIMASFPAEHHEELIPQIQPLVKAGLIARPVDSEKIEDDSLKL